MARGTGNVLEQRVQSAFRQFRQDRHAPLGGYQGGVEIRQINRRNGITMCAVAVVARVKGLGASVYLGPVIF